MKIRQNDTVLVIAGKDKGKTGKVRQVFPQDSQLVVEGINRIKRHMRARPGIRQAGIVTQEAPFPISKVMLLCNKCNHPSRIGSRFLEDGKKVRVCRSCGEVID